MSLNACMEEKDIFANEKEPADAGSFTCSD
jgi:hypothetical protein